MRFSSMTHYEKPKLDERLGIQIYLHEGRSWVQAHWHKEVEIVHAIEGIVTIELGNQIVHLNKGESIIIRPGVPHSFISSPGSIRLAVQLSTETMVKSIYGEYSVGYIENHIDELQIKSIFWEKQISKEVARLIKEIKSNFETEDSFRNVNVLNSVSSLVIVLLEKIPRIDDKELKAVDSSINRLNSLEKLDVIYNFIENNYFRKICLEEVADLVGYSKHYFTRFFKEHTGNTLIPFLNQYRLDQAKWLLITTDLTMSDVAYKSGFQSTKRFHHLFKESTGTSPLKYRKEMLDKEKEIVINEKNS